MTDFRPALHSVADWRAWGPVALEVVLWGALAVNGAGVAWLLLMSPTPPGTVAMPSLAFVPASYPASDPFYPDAGAATGDATLEGYTLHGVRHADGAAGAIIADANGRQHAYRVGDALAPGIVLQAVGPAHASITSGGKHHRLELPPIQVARPLAR